MHSPHQHSWEARCKHKDAILHSMKRRQCKLTIQPTALPSSNELWTSLKTQLLVELQRMARGHRMTLVEMWERILTQTANLTEIKQAWLEQTRKLVSVMPPLPPPPRDLIQGVIPCPSTSTLLNLEVLDPPSMSTPSSIPHLPNPNDLIRQIFRLGQLPTPNSVSRCPRVMKHPFVATLMVPPSNPMKSEVAVGMLATSSRQMSHLGSYETMDSTLSHSPSQTLTESPNTPTTSI